jgi:hypothetical protein
VSRAFAYTAGARMMMWSLTLPQVAATLAATLVAFDTLNPAGQSLIDSRLLNLVLVLMLTSSILGPVLTVESPISSKPASGYRFKTSHFYG